MKKEFQNFEDARKFVQSLNLKNQKEWRQYTQSGKKPKNIPSAPEKVYHKDWISMGDWLGTGFIHPKNYQFRSFEDARKFVQSLNLKNQKEWRQYIKSGNKPNDIPSTPARTYKNNGWIGLSDWLGTKNKHYSSFEFVSFSNARKFAQKLKLRSGTEWKNLAKDDKLPDNIPHDPAKLYKNNWKGWKDFLGYEKQYVPKGEFQNFEDARKFVQSLNLKNQKEWRQFSKSDTRPKDIPSLPARAYPNDWISFGDWLGTGRIHYKYKKFRNFKDAHNFVIKLKFTTTKEWKNYCKSDKRPDDIPTDPQRMYAKNWISLEHWLTGKNMPPRNKKLLDFEDARKFAINLKIVGKKGWMEYIEMGTKPYNIPSDPSGAYKNKGWVNWNDWLGDGNVDPRSVNFKTYDEAKKNILPFGIKSQNEWAKFVKTKQKPIDVPANPSQYYTKEWKGWGDWLGTGIISTIEKSKKWLSWPEAKLLYRKIGQENNLNNLKDWLNYCKKHKLPEGLPANPFDVYTKERVWKKMQE